MWRGMKIDVQVHMDSVSAAYKLWARKIEILLRSQDAWKIKAGLDRGEYSVGIEGQKVRIDPSMVSFVESIPEYVVEEPFDGGVVYLDTRMSKELVAEGYAREIVELVREARQDMKIAQDRIVAIGLGAGQGRRAKLQPAKDMSLRDSNGFDVPLVSGPAVAASPVAPSPNSQWYVYGPPAPPDAIAAKEIVSPSTADVVASVAIAVTSEIVTVNPIVYRGLPAAGSWTVTIAV